MSTDNSEIVVYDAPSDALLDRRQSAETTLRKIDEFQAIVQKHLKEGHDYGVIPGTKKKTLLQPGAQKIFLVTGVAVEYEEIAKVEDWQSDPPFFSYTIRATGSLNGLTIAQALGSANTAETRYARQINSAGTYAKADKGQTPEGERRSKAADLQNTALKIATKRATVALGSHIGALSGIFEQDIEDEATTQAKAVDQQHIENGKPINADQSKLILALKDELVIEDADFRERLNKAYRVATVEELKRGQADNLIKKLKQAKAAPEPEAAPMTTEEVLREQYPDAEVATPTAEELAAMDDIAF